MLTMKRRTCKGCGLFRDIWNEKEGTCSSCIAFKKQDIHITIARLKKREPKRKKVELTPLQDKQQKALLKTFNFPHWYDAQGFLYIVCTRCKKTRRAQGFRNHYNHCAYTQVKKNRVPVLVYHKVKDELDDRASIQDVSAFFKIEEKEVAKIKQSTSYAHYETL